MMEFRNGWFSRYVCVALVLGANLLLPLYLLPIDSRGALPLIALLLLLDLSATYFCLQSTLISIDAKEIRLTRVYLLKWIKPEETRIGLASITRIKRVRGNRGGPAYVVYFEDGGNRSDSVSINGWDIEEPESMARELSRRTGIPIADSWFF